MTIIKGKYRVKNSQNGYDIVHLETSANQVKFDDGKTFQDKLNSGELKGDKGDTGAKGDKGDKGETGASGKDGLTTSVTVDGVKYTHANGNITLPSYPTLSSLGAEPANPNIQEHISSTHAPSDAQKNSDITKAEIEAKLTGTISTHNHDYSKLTNKPDLSVYATQTYVNDKVADFVNSAPETLDTLQELASALGNDPNFATTVTNQIGTKADKNNVYTKVEVDEIVSSSTSINDSAVNTSNTWSSQKINTELNNKIDKEDGKGLSTNDFTTEEKIKLEGLSNYVHPDNESMRHVTDDEKANWNSKAEGSHRHSYSDLDDLPVVDVTKEYVDQELSKKSDVSHNHNDMYYDKNAVDEIIEPITDDYIDELFDKLDDTGNPIDFYSKAESDLKFATKEDLSNVSVDTSHLATKEELRELSNNTGDLNSLQTSNKTNLVESINELFQNANSGKELIANAIGEPLSKDDTFSAMSSDINSLLTSFKTNMMNNGVTVEAGDKFKSLIDKIKTMNENGNSDIKYAEGIIESWFIPASGGKSELTLNDIGLDFSPTLLVVNIRKTTGSYQGYDRNLSFNNIFNNSDFNACKAVYTGAEFYIQDNIITCRNSSVYGQSLSDITWYAIGVGEEDTTLRDSLASILQEEGIIVTEEDDMANLITKVDKEFENKNNSSKALSNCLINKGYDITGSESFEELLNLLEFGIKGNDIKQISCGYAHTFILKNDGDIWCTGFNEYGQLGLSNQTNQGRFIKTFDSNIKPAKQIVCGANSTFILKEDNTLWSCGYNGSGQLGINSLTNTTVFKQCSSDVKKVVHGNGNTFILKNDGTLWSCGKCDYGQLGLNKITTGTTKTFTQVTNNVSDDVKDVFVSFYNAFILKNDGTLWGCGKNDYGQLGLGDTTDRKVFTQINIDNVKEVVGGSEHTFILKNDGTALVAGNNKYGQLGLGESTSNVTIFTQIETNVKQVSCGGSYTYILKNDNTLWSAGVNSNGQLGFNDTTDKYIFTLIENNANMVKNIYSGWYYGFLVKYNGELCACGSNSYGALGMNSTGGNKEVFTNIYEI